MTPIKCKENRTHHASAISHSKNDSSTYLLMVNHAFQKIFYFCLCEINADINFLVCDTTYRSDSWSGQEGCALIRSNDSDHRTCRNRTSCIVRFKRRSSVRNTQSICRARVKRVWLVIDNRRRKAFTRVEVLVDGIIKVGLSFTTGRWYKTKAFL